jgi:ribosomal protein L31|mmetsp:Transcript_1932/g.6699  ORF Transcript_1932/g.6699 Transcript_1932/m.6699 type:complete len:83 (-) Transcript_1932:7585-7833(-)
MAKKGLHPLLYRITVVGTKGGTFPLFSAVKHKAQSYFLQQDHDTHVTWTGKVVESAATGQVAKFKRRFDFLSAANAVVGKKK